MRKAFTAGAILATVAVTSAITYSTIYLGPAPLTEDTAEVYNSQVNADVVRFYQDMCAIHEPATRAVSDTLLKAAEDSVGNDDPAPIYAQARIAIADQWEVVRQGLPRDMPDSVYDPTSRQGKALAPLVDRADATLGAGIVAAREAVDEFEATQEVITQTNVRLSGVLSDLADFAPLSSTATYERVSRMPECEKFFKDEDTRIYEDIVRAHVDVERSRDEVVEVLSSPEGMDIGALVEVTAAARERMQSTPVAPNFDLAASLAERVRDSLEADRRDEAENHARQVSIEVGRAPIRLAREMPVPNEATQTAIDKELGVA